VVENEDKNIIPNEKNADYTINSFLPYELGVIKPYLLHVVSYDFSKSHEKELYDLIQMKFKNIEEIPSRFVPTDSVFREFIGKES
jgi:uridine kinase